MTVNEAHLIYFSPTHTSKQVGEAIVCGTGIKNVIPVDLTLQMAEKTVIPASSLAIIVVPVYGGHVAPLAMERLENICGLDTPTVLVVVYGNRAYEKALIELDTFAIPHGFKIIAGATFIGEHSYSTDKNPIAQGRPDDMDLNLANEFGSKIMEKIQAAISPDKLYQVDIRAIRRPAQPFFALLRFLWKVIKLRKSDTPLPRTPWVEEESLCTHCGLCVTRCPAGAIIKGDELHTDADKCIKCCACVKCCNKNARVYDTPFAALLADCFKKQKLPQTIL
ncbi:4Fe-4S dicluster domain-containing protein [Bacteroides sp.]|uniref:4Fe-4S dicluster domain-containing protein n=1 Tax=Bacteroides sp. TaxID=29523 RepID=UPI00262B3DCB|nr:4Fe-4S dicluster domain-containing protein [Bacteroides sp.]MDD3038189.1 4Fe-4S dicluster domain-containing protein [Bacteroides sp.]